MNTVLAVNMFYAAPQFWYSLGVLIFALLSFIVYQGVKILKLRQKAYFLNRDRERYAETLYASKDGYFAFIVPDKRVNDPRKEVRQRCSRKLAVILNLEKGTESSFDEVLKCFYKDSAKKISLYANLLKEEGVPFEEDFISRVDNKHINLTGRRISTSDDNIFCDMIWFRDITKEKSQIFNLIEEKNGFFNKVIQFENMINNIPYPVWLRDKNLEITLANKKYYSLLQKKNYENNLLDKMELKNSNGENLSKNLALLAIGSNKRKESNSKVIIDGQIKTYQVSETPFYSELALDNICTVGTMIDISEFEETKLKRRMEKDNQLEFVGSLSNTAFAVFSDDYKLSFCNNFFKDFWQLEDVWTRANPSYGMFLETIRNKRLIPEVSNFAKYKEDEYKSFGEIVDPYEDMLHLPDGRTIRRVRSRYMEGLIFAYEDVSDKLATRREYNSVLSVQNEMLNNISDAILIFDSNGKLTFYNEAYIKLWNAKKDDLIIEPNIFEVVESQIKSFRKISNLEKLKEEILNHITNSTTKTFTLQRDDNIEIEISSIILSNTSMMLTYKKSR